MSVSDLLRDIEDQCFDTSPHILKPILSRVGRYAYSDQHTLIKALARRTGTTQVSMSNLLRAHMRRFTPIPKSKRLSPRGQALHFEYYWNRHAR